MSRHRCPTCQNEFEVEKTVAMPFCSIRCRLVDLGTWLEERRGISMDRDEIAEEKLHSDS